MSLAQQLHAEHKARLIRMGGFRSAPELKVVANKQKPLKPINPEPYYRGMWFYDLINPRSFEPKIDPTVLSIRNAVCKYFSVSVSDLESHRRYGSLVYHRQIAFWLARRYTSYSFPQIGRRFGDRDHSTIIHGCRRIEAKIKSDWTVAYDIAHLEAML